MPDAWLFDVYPHPRKSALVVWIKHGEAVTKHLVPYQPTFCIKAEADSLEKAERLMQADARVQATWHGETALWLRGPKHPVLRIQPKCFQDMVRVATDLRKATKSKGYLFFDVDNQPESRWMHEQGLWSMCRLATEPVPAPASGGSGDGKDGRSAGAWHGQDNASDAVAHHENKRCAAVGHNQNNDAAGVALDEKHDGSDGPPGPGGSAAARRESSLDGAPGVGGGRRGPVISHASHRGGVQGVGAARRPVGHAADAGVCAGKVIWPLRPHPDDERYTIDYPDPGLKTAWLRVDVDKQGHTADFLDPLVSVQLGDTTWTVTDDPGSERGVLLALGAHLRALDPDVIFTKHGDRFDVPYLLHAIRRHGLQEKVVLGRDRDPDPAHPDQEGKSISTYGRWLYKTSAYYLRGRWHVDLSKKTLDSEDDRKDIHGILYLTRVSNRRAQDINRNGAGYALQQMQIDEAIDMGTALPWKRNLAEDWKDAATLCAVDRGGQIMVPAPGIYEDVAACDFSGYYPSLVVRHNLSSDTINCPCCPDGPIVPELNYHVCEKNQGHQSGILKRIAPHRKWAKAVLRRHKAST